jgi:hypothetical protein
MIVMGSLPATLFPAGSATVKPMLSVAAVVPVAV